YTTRSINKLKSITNLVCIIMASVQRKNSNFVVISCIALFLVVIALGFQPLQAQTDDDGCPTGKTSWPELVGVVGCKAATQIESENSAYNPVVIPKDAAVPRNFDCTRVFVRIDGYQGLVSQTPTVG
ncbi:serine protease inhibitor, partial [Paucibacter sp. DJ4R-1]|nr:serine protease inhibitor [Paucibacter sp. DJ4R-1]